MKITLAHRQSGSAMIVVITLLVIVMAYIAGNLRALEDLRREIKLVERHQIRRVQSANANTNAIQIPAYQWIASPPSTNH
jgi:hypothetical protein